MAAGVSSAAIGQAKAIASGTESAMIFHAAYHLPIQRPMLMRSPLPHDAST